MDLAPHTSSALLHAVARDRGLIAVAGPAGSGKRTTARALLKEAGTSRTVMTRDAISAERGVDDWCVIYLGEVRDVATEQVCVELATKTLVVAVFRSGFSLQLVQRLVDGGIELDKLARARPIIVSQKLVERLCKQCRIAYHPGDVEFTGLPFGVGDLALTNGFAYGPAGCAFCDQGYDGSVALFEVLSPSLKSVDEITGELLADLRADAVLKAMSGLTSLAELRRVL